MCLNWILFHYLDHAKILLWALFLNTYKYILVTVLSIFFLYNKIFQQSELQVTFPFQPEENTAIWATISGNAILNHSFVCMNIQNWNQDHNQAICSHIMYLLYC